MDGCDLSYPGRGASDQHNLVLKPGHLAILGSHLNEDSMNREATATEKCVSV